MTAYPHLFQPLGIGPVTIANRIVRTAHSTGTTGDDLIAYHEQRAQAGLGLTIIEIAGVLPTSATAIPVFSDRVLPFFEELSARLHRHGTKVFQQLWHGGAAYGRAGTPISASAIPNPHVNVVPTPMTHEMIGEVVQAFAEGARRCRDGGLDGVELHAAHGYLIGQFLSPALNVRDDEYGGSTEGRTRFVREIVAAIRREAGDDFPLGVRLSGTDFIEGGIDVAEATSIATILSPLVDFVDVSMSSYWRFHKFLSTMDDPLGYEIETSEQVTRAISVPTIVTGRIMTLDHADHLVAEGTADMVSMVRAMIADPMLIAKAREGREAEVRPCIGTSMGCVAQLMTTGRLQCVVNVAAGRERTTPVEVVERARTARRVLVVGGGVAGMEAARTAALRGHDVHLHEQRSRLGGQITVASAAPHRGDLAAITGFLASELERLGVHVHLRSAVDPDVVAELSPDEIIVATGATPRRDGFQLSTPSRSVPGFALPHVRTAWDVITSPPRTAGPAVVYDDTGTFEAISAADALIAAGTPAGAITIVGRGEQLGANLPYPPATVEASSERLLGAGVTFLPHLALREITADDVAVRGVGYERTIRLPADVVVVCTYHEPERGLAEALRADGRRIHVVGDATGTSTIQAAIRSATDATRSL